MDRKTHADYLAEAAKLAEPKQFDTTFTDSRGVQYGASQLATGVKVGPDGKPRNMGYTIRRTSPRPVDIKRAARAMRKETRI